MPANAAEQTLESIGFLWRGSVKIAIGICVHCSERLCVPHFVSIGEETSKREVQRLVPIFAYREETGNKDGRSLFDEKMRLLLANLKILKAPFRSQRLRLFFMRKRAERRTLTVSECEVSVGGTLAIPLTRLFFGTFFARFAVHAL